MQNENKILELLGQISGRLEALETEQRGMKSEMNQRFDAVDERFAGMDQRFDAVDERFAGMDQRFDAVDERFAGMVQRFDAVDERFAGMVQRFDAVDERFDSLEYSLNKAWEDIGLAEKRTQRHELEFHGVKPQIPAR